MIFVREAHSGGATQDKDTDSVILWFDSEGISKRPNV